MTKTESETAHDQTPLVMSTLLQDETHSHGEKQSFIRGGRKSLSKPALGIESTFGRSENLNEMIIAKEPSPKQKQPAALIEIGFDDQPSSSAVNPFANRPKLSGNTRSKKGSLVAEPPKSKVTHIEPQ